MTKIVLLIAAFLLTVSALGYFALAPSQDLTPPTRNHRVLPSSLRPGTLELQKPVEQAKIYGLTEDDKHEVLYTINQLKKTIKKGLTTEAGQFIKSGIPMVNWDEGLAQEAAQYSEKCPSTRQSSMKDGIMVARVYNKEKSLTDMIQKWQARFEAWNGIEQDQYKAEKIGCAKSSCYMDDREAVSLVCRWRFEGDVLVGA